MSDINTLSKSDWKKSFKSALVWFSPVLLMWTSAILGALQQEGHIFSWNDLVPTTLTIGAMVAWGIGRFQDLILRFRADEK